MRRIALALVLAFAFSVPFAVWAQPQPFPQPGPLPGPNPPPPPPCEISPAPPDPSGDLTFIGDAGIRIDHAALPKPFVDDMGRVHLFYEEDLGPGRSRQLYATSEDGLTFDAGRPEAPEDLAFHPFRVRMPNGVWRLYSWDPRQLVLRSRSAGDGVSFGDDVGTRYSLQPEDAGWMGIHDEYVDAKGRVVLLYLGDRLGLNNVRRAVSTDNGWTFTFERGDVLGDSDKARREGAGSAFVDHRSLGLPDGSRRLFVMRRGCAIYSFRSADGDTWTEEAGARVTTSTWEGLPVRSLHDPVVVRLPDGRFRMYVCARLEGTGSSASRQVILTATTELARRLASPARQHEGAP